MDNDATVIIGAGPAGLTAAWLMTRHGAQPLVLEKDTQVGGIARTVEYRGFRFDIGGHRFFTKVGTVQKLWRDMLGAEFLSRPRLSRIYYGGKFFDYPLKPMNALMGLGPINALQVLLSYLWIRVRPVRPELTFEDWVTNRFGRRLYIDLFQDLHREGVGNPLQQDRGTVGRAAHQGAVARQRDRQHAVARSIAQRPDQDADP